MTTDPALVAALARLPGSGASLAVLVAEECDLSADETPPWLAPALAALADRRAHGPDTRPGWEMSHYDDVSLATARQQDPTARSYANVVDFLSELAHELPDVTFAYDGELLVLSVVRHGRLEVQHVRGGLRVQVRPD